MKDVWFVTGGAGFIGGNFVLEAVAATIQYENQIDDAKKKYAT